MSTLSASSNQTRILRNDLDKEFAEFFIFCKKQKFNSNDLKIICEPLKKIALRKFFNYLFILILICVLLLLACNFIESISWALSAFGRIILIKILPIWDWRNLYNTKCLVTLWKNTRNYGAKEAHSKVITLLGKYETEPNNCGLCEHFDRIDIISNATFFDIQRHYLEKGLPVLINDSHFPQNLKNFALHLKETINFVESDPCDVETNFLLNRFINIEDLLGKSLEDENDNDVIDYDNENTKLSSMSSSWFFHLRNCQFSAIKASRKFIQKPYFYPSHLEPFYSSWVLMSKDFYTNSRKELYLEGIIIVQQIVGQMIITLTAKKPCEKLCGEHSFLIKEGESLVFTTDLWIFSYSLEDFGESAATITETRWN